MRFWRVFDDEAVGVPGKVAAMYAILITANLGAWVWALVAFHRFPVLIGTAFVAYSFGLRHAFDADHIAAIDNVTRKLMQNGKKPISVGFFFSLGHSSIVVALTVTIAALTVTLQERFDAFRVVGGVIGTSISAFFLLIVAVANILILMSVYRTFRKVKNGGRLVEQDLDSMLAGGGLLARIFRPLFGVVRRSWHMYPLGLLFGLGFDTATEVGLLGISASQAAQGLSIWTILVFPALFTAGMSLLDATDSVLMLGAYNWAFVKPVRKLYYNMTITAVSVVVALLVGGIEALGMMVDRLQLQGGVWDIIGALNDNFGMIGYVIVAVFIVSWIVSMLVYRLKGYDDVEIASV
ncbi:HoxN/HupN/NixA family nickel/cobalt transporter [Lichenifustis flavocetrariae]|uniref:Nickel/cobalt efflux system n=1 Tax=Lichenifustis flavocetrariae TaxID=2949735 RepID=A0AA42CLW3_9HYPH|nr:HoxN/HupN/NixA family nickel/cobalt transporter [Lichenifustis flavocetrariae]MCW6510876.1 HoxN/HupN/NixA family nickel/cobalt transporter [Lichenifustis flavocetrariae]